MEAITFGLPFEVWKTHMGSFRNQSTVESFKNIYSKGGIRAFWSGWQPKMVESFLKGGILLFAKDAIIRSTSSMGMGEVTSGLVGGFGGGVAQVVVLGPCTYLVTAAVTGNKSSSIFTHIKNTMATRGIAGFYSGGTALMLRQGSNWASRQGFTDLIRAQFKKSHGGDQKTAKLSVWEEAISGTIGECLCMVVVVVVLYAKFFISVLFIVGLLLLLLFLFTFLGGALSTWNQPFEVMRIEAQSAAAKGLPAKGFFDTFKGIVKDSGPLGLFKGIVPRIGICVWQTLFMVTIPYILKPYGF